ncbi:MAG TPA: RNA polymerase sigma factor [Vicinamibacterales bacterium]|nr:RNA polymerase sigma factor [Vicinamibacterales bacterium]
MTLRDVTLSDVERLDAAAGEADVAFDMDEETFRAFYDRTARPLWAYLSRLAGSAQAADDLLQESYYRLLRSRGRWDSEAHRRAYLFRIATNLVRDNRRRALHRATLSLTQGEEHSLAAPGTDVATRSAARTDLQRAMARLRPRDRALLWLAYAQGQAHVEIAEILGVKTASVKLLLFRARRRLAALLRGSARDR